MLPGERHLVRLSGFSLRRSARKAIDETIVFDDQTYLPGETVDMSVVRGGEERVVQVELDGKVG